MKKLIFPKDSDALIYKTSLGISQKTNGDKFHVVGDIFHAAGDKFHVGR